MPLMTRRSLMMAGAGTLALSAMGRRSYARGQYDTGASDTEIKIGNTNPYSGNLSAYGVIGHTHDAIFKMINAQGGINGRKITFISYDDGYSPPKTVEMVRKLVEEDGVLLLFNTLGTPSNTAIHKYANAKKVPQLFVASGASKWGDPKNFPWTMGYQPDYQTEAAIYAQQIRRMSPAPAIGILYQNDDYGKDYLTGFRKGLGPDGEKLIVQEQSYEATDPTVDSQMIELKNSGATVFFNITTPKFAAQAIRKVADLGWKPVHYLNNVSASVGAVLSPAGLDNSQGIITATYLKDVTDPQWKSTPDMTAWRTFMAQYAPHLDAKDQATGFAWSVANTMIEVLKRCGDNLTRENVMRQAASLQHFVAPLLLPGIEVNTGPTDFYPIQAVQLSRFEGKSFKLLGDVIHHESS